MTDDKISFRNPKYVECFREVVKARILLYQTNPQAMDKGEANLVRLADQHYPDDIEKQLDFHVCFNLVLEEAEKLGYTNGVAPTELAFQIAKECNVEGAFIVERLYAVKGGSS